MCWFWFGSDVQPAFMKLECYDFEINIDYNLIKYHLNSIEFDFLLFKKVPCIG